MVRERCLKKSFKDSLEDIKERMKEKRNKKWAKLGKATQVISAKGKITDNSVTQLKSCQANNRALALALEEEKRKLREAQDIILHLKREYQHLKFQQFILQQKLQTQGQGHAETKLMALKKIVLKVFQDLHSATNLLGLTNDQCATYLSHIPNSSHLEECNSSRSTHQDSLALLRHVLAVDSVENAPPLETAQRNTGWQPSSQDDHLNCGNRYPPLNEKGREVGSGLPKSVSIRRRCLVIKDQNALSLSNDMGVTQQLKDPCMLDETGSDKDVGERNENSEETYICQENVCDMNSDQTVEQPNVLTDTTTLPAVPKQTDLKIAGGSKAHREKGQKRKLEIMKNGNKRSKSRSKKERSHSEQQCSEGKTDTSIGCSDAYDFVHEESIHITPFKQNKENENNTADGHCIKETEPASSDLFTSEEDSDDSLHVPYSKKAKSKKSFACKTDVSPVHTRPFKQNKENENNTADGHCIKETEPASSDSFTSKEDSDDSLYVPYSKKSKSKTNMTCKTDVSPVHTRPRLRRIVCNQHDNTTDERNRNIRQLEKSFDEETVGGACENMEQSNASVARRSSGPDVVVIDAGVPCLDYTETDKVKKCNKNSSKNCSFEKDEPSVILPNVRLHLGDITNFAPSPSSNQSRVSHPPLNTGIKDTSDSRRRCTVSVSYKEPSINKKLRRGDPFTDTGFLSSPIFKEKKSGSRKSVKKKSLSRYNEAFVGYL